jgi:hypothetical protein
VLISRYIDMHRHTKTLSMLSYLILSYLVSGCLILSYLPHIFVLSYHATPSAFFPLHINISIQSSSNDVPASHNTTFSLMTYNLWKTAGVPTMWETRCAVLRRQLQKLDPDVLLAQELCPEITACVLEALPYHSCIGNAPHLTQTSPDGCVASSSSSELFRGLTHEGNIFFRASLFEPGGEYGYEDIRQEEEYRRLFWIRLRFKGGEESKTVLFSTAHFTWQGHPKECNTDLNLRKIQARETARALDRLQRPSEACFFGGDLNESFWPKRILETVGFRDPFSDIGLPCGPTHPCRPTLAHEDVNCDSTLDWLFARPSRDQTSMRVRPLLCVVVRDMVGLSSEDPDERNTLQICPSDHCPVLAIYRITTPLV